MSTGQIIIIGLGAIMILSSLDIGSLLPKVENKTPLNPVIKPQPQPQKSDLIAVVQKWDDLKNICVSNGLTEATAKLDEIFPMLIKVDK
jgi:hypothetical protein